LLTDRDERDKPTILRVDGLVGVVGALDRIGSPLPNAFHFAGAIVALAPRMREFFGHVAVNGDRTFGRVARRHKRRVGNVSGRALELCRRRR
jgi:hypothetical protein